MITHFNKDAFQTEIYGSNLRFYKYEFRKHEYLKTGT